MVTYIDGQPASGSFDKASQINLNNGKTVQDGYDELNATLDSVVDKFSKRVTGDLNNLKESGFYYCAGGVTNSPSGTTYGVILVVYGNYPMQLYSSATGSLFYRAYTNSGDWTNWKTIV